MFLSPVDIQHVRLRHRLLGYKRADVKRLLERTTESYEEIWLERDSLRAEVAQLREQLESAKERERLVAEVLLNARKIAATTVAEARKQADDLLREARREPERLREEIRRLKEVEQTLHARLRLFLLRARALLVGDREFAEQEEDGAPLGALRLPEEETGGEAEVPAPAEALASADDPETALQGLS